MGQYQQWLHFQEIDRRLRATLDALEQELGQVESQLNGSQQPDMSIDNPIISALSMYVTALKEEADSCNNGSARGVADQSSTDASETISAALLHWGELPDFGPQQLDPSEQHEILPFQSLDYAEIELLPDDMFAFFEEHSQTDPQLELPWWLRKITITNGDDDGGKPIDQESIRTNRLVQRWVERWGRQSPDGFTPESENEGIRDEE